MVRLVPSAARFGNPALFHISQSNTGFFWPIFFVLSVRAFQWQKLMTAVDDRGAIKAMPACEKVWTLTRPFHHDRCNPNNGAYDAFKVLEVAYSPGSEA